MSRANGGDGNQFLGGLKTACYKISPQPATFASLQHPQKSDNKENITPRPHNTMESDRNTSGDVVPIETGTIRPHGYILDDADTNTFFDAPTGSGAYVGIDTQ